MKAKRKPPQVRVLSKHYKAIQWCVNNGIRIYPRPLLNGYYQLIYEKDGIPKTSGTQYTKDEYPQVWWDYWLFVYEKLAE